MYAGHMTYRNHIAEKIRDVCEDQHRSIAWLSEQAGIADKTLRRRLVDPDGFRIVELSAIATALETNLEDLVQAA